MSYVQPAKPKISLMQYFGLSLIIYLADSLMKNIRKAEA